MKEVNRVRKMSGFGPRWGAMVLLVAMVSACGDDEGSADVTQPPRPIEQADDPGGAPDTPAPPVEQADNSGGAPDTPAPPAPDAPDAEDDADGGDHAELTGEPVVVYVIEDSSEAVGITYPSVRAAVQARTDRINAEGGLGRSGRPLEVRFCVSDFDQNAAAQCARDAAEDASVVAVVASVSASGDVVLPILEDAGLASIGSSAFSIADGISEVSFPVMGGLFAAAGCQATLLQDFVGAEAIAVAYTDSPAADQVVALLNVILAPRGASIAGEVVTPVAQPDYSAELNAVTTGADGLVLGTDGGTAQKIVQQLARLGSDVAVVGSGGQSWTPRVLDSLGDAAEGMYLATWFATDDMPGSGVDAYLADMETVGALELSDDLAKLGWTSLDLLDQLAAELDEIDRATVLDGLRSMSAFDSGGLTPVLDFTQPGTLLPGPRFVNDTCVYAQVEDGRIVARSDGFVAPLTED